MKVIYYFLAILSVIFFASSCIDEPYTEGNPDFILSFQRDGRTTAMAGSYFYVLPTGSAEFLTLYDGTKGHVWGETGATGIDLNKMDSIGLKYDSIGHFTLSLVATSIGKMGEKISKLAKTVEIDVVDERNTISNFYMNGVQGIITKENQILFSFPDNTTNFTYTPIFELASNSIACKVTVNGVQQVSQVSAQTFTPGVPVIYTVKSPEGKENTYSVILSLYKSSNNCKLLKFNLGSGVGTNGFGEIGIIDEQNKTVNLNVNYATDLSSVLVVLESSYLSTAKIGTKTYSASTSKKPFSLSGSTNIGVTAEDKVTIGNYSLKINVQNPIVDFTFAGFKPDPIRTIDILSKTITIDIAKGTDISKLKAVWTGSAGVVTVKQGETEVTQTNGVTENDYSTPLKYTFYKGNSSLSDLTRLKKGDEYTVYVNLK